MTIRLAVWSGPRNISTAFMRSWENRADTTVVDEPFYAAYLARTGAGHPMREDVLTSQPTDPAAVVETLLRPALAPVAYSKQMAHHIAGDMDLRWTLSLRNVLLIRDPREVVASYLRARDVCTPEDIGVLQQRRLWQYWASTGVDAPVIDARDFLRAPEAHLRWLCGWIGVPFAAEMLSWPSGPRDSDGVWAPHWYAAVRRSTGFEPYRPREVSLTPDGEAVAHAVHSAYEGMWLRRLSV